MNTSASSLAAMFKTDSSSRALASQRCGKPVRLTSHAAWLIGTVFAGMTIGTVLPASADEPGDIIVERVITPRIAYDSVPKKDDPVAVRVTTFPKSTFDGVMGGLVSDLDLNGARGSAGVAGSGSTSALAAATAALGVGSAAQQRNGAPMGLSGMGGTNTIGTTVSQTITGALAPLTSGLGNLK
jgi:hypothetical protein